MAEWMNEPVPRLSSTCEGGRKLFVPLQICHILKGYLALFFGAQIKRGLLSEACNQLPVLKEGFVESAAGLLLVFEFSRGTVCGILQILGHTRIKMSQYFDVFPIFTARNISLVWLLQNLPSMIPVLSNVTNPHVVLACDQTSICKIYFSNRQD